MKETFLLLLIAFVVGTGCKNGGTDNKHAPDADSTRFFQVAQFIKKEIEEVNKTPYYIYKIERINNKQDSTPINITIFNQLSEDFLKPDINDKDLKPKYRENIFEDKTTGGFTISYSPQDKNVEIQNVEILLKDDGHNVKRIFIRKFLNYADSSAIEQLSWKPGESFQINRSVQKADGSENAKQTNVVWNQKS